jgi:hypothetical protein
MQDLVLFLIEFKKVKIDNLNELRVNGCPKLKTKVFDRCT